MIDPLIKVAINQTAKVSFLAKKLHEIQGKKIEKIIQKVNLIETIQDQFLKPPKEEKTIQDDPLNPDGIIIFRKV